MPTALVLNHSASDHLGGAEQSLLAVLEAWQRAEPSLDPLVVSPGPGAMNTALIERGFRTAIVSMSGWTVPSTAGGRASREVRRRQNARATRELLRIIDEEHPGVVVTNTLVHPWAAIAASSRGVPHVWFVREFGDEAQGFRWPDGRATALADIAALSTAVVANSRAVASMFDGTRSDTTVVVSYPPVDIHSVRSRAAETIDEPVGGDPRFRVGVLGRVTRSKGQWRLVEALAHVTTGALEVRMVGAVLDPGAEHDLVARARALAPDARVRFDGEQENPFPSLAMCDIAVIPSDKEAFGRSTLECLAIGLPVITTSSGAGAELVMDGVCGRLVDPDDFAALGEAIDAYARDENLRAAHSSAARRRADELVQGPTSVSTAIDAVREAAASAPRALPSRWAAWIAELDTIPEPGRDRVLRTRAAVVGAMQLLGRALRDPGRALRRLRSSLR